MAGVIEVWRVDARRVSGGALLLSPEEAERASGFRFDRDRDVFVSVRAALRTLVGNRLGIAPREVVIHYGPNGKPEVDGMSFNVSHAGEVALIALGTGKIGVDVEEMRPDVDMLAVARRFFTPAENEALDQLMGRELARGFYGCWTQKEAFVKAVGKGLPLELDRVEVAVHPRANGLLSLDGEPEAAAQWTVAEIVVSPGYAAAVAADAPGARPVLRDWPEDTAT